MTSMKVYLVVQGIILMRSLRYKLAHLFSEVSILMFGVRGIVQLQVGGRDLWLHI
jgi:hypothetical protein